MNLLPRRIASATLGCKLNQYESEAVLGQFRRLGWQSVAFDEEAELVLIDTCTVTNRADQKARNLIRQAIRRNPEAMVVVMGCYGQSSAEEIARIPGVDLVVGNQEKRHLPELVGEPAKRQEARICVARPAGSEDRTLLSLEGFEHQTRAWLKIQDGCDVFCSFCIIPFTRGRSRSMLPDEVEAQARELLSAGYRELVLTGVHMGDYGRDLEPSRSLAWLCDRLLQAPDLMRLRLSSIEPWDITDELLDVMAADPRFCPHLHTALQSGSDSILAAMGRRIDRSGIRSLYERIKNRLPHAGLGTDLIVGFPGEEERHFRETVDLVDSLPLNNLHVFPFSPRKGTRAASLPGAVPAAERRDRCRLLLDLGDTKKAHAHQAMLGREVDVLLEGGQQGRTESRQTSLFGYTPDYLRVEVPIAGNIVADLVNQMVRVQIVKSRGDCLLASPYLS